MAETAPPPRYISCDPTIYAEGGFIDFPDVMERIRAEHAAAPPEITTDAVLYGPPRYERALRREQVFAPDETFAAIAAGYERTLREHPAGPAAVLVNIRNARILDRAIYQMRDGVARPLYETHRPGDRPYLQWTDATGPAEELPDNQDYFLLSSAGTFNWGHWLVDDLARLKGVLTRAAAGRRRLCVLVHAYFETIDLARLDSLKALVDPALSVTFRLIFPNRVYLARTLYFASPVSIHPALKHPEALADLARHGQRALGERRRPWRKAKPRPRRLFVTRRPAWGRVPVNLEEVHAAVRRRGYEIVDPEGRSGAEQIAPFVAADTVVGLMGAAMGGSLFCPEGARLLYLAPETFEEPFYWDQAAARGQDYAVVYGRATDPDAGHRSSYEVDPARLEQALDALG